MKKYLVIFLALFVFSVGMPFLGASDAHAQRYRKSYKKAKKVKRYRSRNVYRTPRRTVVRRNNYRNNGYRSSNDGYYRTRGYSVNRQPPRRRVVRRNNYGNNGYRSSNDRYYQTRGYTVNRQQPRRRSFYRRHRNTVNIGVGTAAGAIIGGIIGGKKGALIGAGVGAGSAAIYSYGIKPKKKRYRNRRN